VQTPLSPSSPSCPSSRNGLFLPVARAEPSPSPTSFDAQHYHSTLSSRRFVAICASIGSSINLRSTNLSNLKHIKSSEHTIECKSHSLRSRLSGPYFLPFSFARSLVPSPALPRSITLSLSLSLSLVHLCQDSCSHSTHSATLARCLPHDNNTFDRAQGHDRSWLLFTASKRAVSAAPCSSSSSFHFPFHFISRYPFASPFVGLAQRRQVRPDLIVRPFTDATWTDKLSLFSSPSVAPGLVATDTLICNYNPSPHTNSRGKQWSLTQPHLFSSLLDPKLALSFRSPQLSPFPFALHALLVKRRDRPRVGRAETVQHNPHPAKVELSESVRLSFRRLCPFPFQVISLLSSPSNPSIIIVVKVLSLSLASRSNRM
jgi:hypothetical protein